MTNAYFHVIAKPSADYDGKGIPANGVKQPFPNDLAARTFLTGVATAVMTDSGDDAYAYLTIEDGVPTVEVYDGDHNPLMKGHVEPPKDAAPAAKPAAKRTVPVKKAATGTAARKAAAPTIKKIDDAQKKARATATKTVAKKAPVKKAVAKRPAIKRTAK
jgi:hypothetical protein